MAIPACRFRVCVYNTYRQRKMDDRERDKYIRGGANGDSGKRQVYLRSSGHVLPIDLRSNASAYEFRAQAVSIKRIRIR